jgi:SAM-dependent methyltransferase
MLLGGELGYRLLRRFNVPPNWRRRLSPTSTPKPSQMEAFWGPGIWQELAGRVVIDFGCGCGGDVIEIARRGAARVIGLDIVPTALQAAASAAAQAGVADVCAFATTTDVTADRIVCNDAFEHFADPAAILRTMHALLRPGGAVLVTFGPPWLHPYGGHSFSVFPWSHLLFTEGALCRWRSDYRDDGAKHFAEVQGGLNCMTVHCFRRLVAQSPLRLAAFETLPIRALRWLHNRLSREYLTSVVRCRLVRDP